MRRIRHRTRIGLIRHLMIAVRGAAIRTGTVVRAVRDRAELADARALPR